MAMTGRFDANFTSFYEACQKAVVELKGFDAATGQVESSLNRMVDNFSGRKIMTQAELMVTAIDKIGGAAYLTEAELQKVGAVAQEAAEKFRAWGQDVPANIQKYADAAENAAAEQKTLNEAAESGGGIFGELSSQILANATAFISAQSIIAAVNAAYQTLVGFVKDSVNAYAEQESAEVKLTAALRQHSLATPEVIHQYNQLATTFQNTTRYADEQINAMEALLTQVGGVMPSAMQDALKASTDLAAGLGIDLQSATMLVAKAAAGHTETLGRYGVTVSEAELASKGFEAVLEAVNRQFGGQAQADLDTYAGKIDQMKNSWNNVEEALGKIIVKDPFVTAALRDTANALQDADDKSQGTGKSLADLAADFGLTDRVTADLAHRLGDYIDGLNAEHDAVDRILKQPSPFEKMANDMAAHPITTGLKVANDLWAEHERELKANKEAAAKYAEAMVAINSVGENWRATLDTMNGATVEGIKYYLQAGVEQGKLAAAYGVTAEQVRAVAASIKDEAEAEKLAFEAFKFHQEEAAKISKEFAAQREADAKRTNAAVLAEFYAQVKLNQSMGLDAEGAIKLQTTALDIANQKMHDLQLTKANGISQDKQIALIQKEFTDAMLAAAQADDKEAQARIDASNRAAEAQKSNLQQIADRTALTYQRALNDYTRYTDKQLTQLQAAAEAAAQAVEDAAERAATQAEQAFMSFHNTIVLDTKDLTALNKELTSFYDQLAARGPVGQLSGGYVGTPKASPTFRAIGMPSFGEGGSGDFGSGTPVMLHGKEAIVPLDTTGTELRYGGSAGVVGGNTINLTIHVTQPLGTPEAIARAVGDAQIALLKGQGMRLPYGT